MLLWTCLFALAFAQEPAAPTPSDGDDSDIVARTVVPASPAEVAKTLSDLRAHEGLWPEGCTRKWVHGTVNVGPGAAAELVYTMGPMRRRLAMTLSRAEGERLVELDHAGNKGFVSRFTLTPGELGTEVVFHTWVNAPPKPFRKLYTRRVQPVWQSCQQGFLDALAAGAR